MHRLRSLSLLSVLLTALLWTQTALAGDGTQLLPLLPSSSKLVVGINLDALRSAPVFQQVMGVVGASPQYRAMLSEVQSNAPSFDPVQHIQTVVISMDTQDGSDSDSMLMLAEIVLEPAVIRTALQASKPDATFEEAESGAWMVIHDDAALASLGNNIFAFGKIEYVRAAMNGAATGLSRSLASQVRSLDRSHALWAAMNAPRDVAAQMTMMRGSLQITSEVRTALVITAASEEMAAELVGDFETTRAQLSGSPEIAQFGLAPVVQSIQTSASGSEMTITATIDAATWTMISSTALAILAAEF